MERRARGTAAVALACAMALAVPSPAVAESSGQTEVTIQMVDAQGTAGSADATQPVSRQGDGGTSSATPDTGSPSPGPSRRTDDHSAETDTATGRAVLGSGRPETPEILPQTGRFPAAAAPAAAAGALLVAGWACLRRCDRVGGGAHGHACHRGNQ